MNEVLNAIEQELLIAIRRRTARRGRRRSLLAAASALALALTSIGIAAVSDTPIERLLHGSTPLAERTNAPKLELRVTDPGGLGWSATTYLTTRGMLGSTAAPDGLTDRFPTAGGVSGFAIADNLLEGPVTDASLDVVEQSGVQHYLFSGTVAADVRAVAVTLSSEHRTAVLSPDAISLPVDRPDGLTEQGRQRYAQMPPTVSVRAYAVAFSPNLLADQQIVRATLTVTLADGTQRDQESARFCVSSSCGARIAKVS